MLSIEWCLKFLIILPRYIQPVDDDNAQGANGDDSATVKRPSPLAIGIIEQFLREKRMRLIDLFSAGDKDKSWTLTREEFKAAVQQVNDHQHLWTFLIINNLVRGVKTSIIL